VRASRKDLCSPIEGRKPQWTCEDNRGEHPALKRFAAERTVGFGHLIAADVPGNIHDGHRKVEFEIRNAGVRELRSAEARRFAVPDDRF
jgi:hypothetical protein